MKIDVIGIGKIKEKYLTAGIEEFLKRLKPYCNLNIVELSEEYMPENASLAEKNLAIKKEGERMLKRVAPSSYVIVLDVKGKQVSSEELAAKFEGLALEGKSYITFVIGGAFGLSSDVVQAADMRLSFSKMTFTHQMIRLLLVEQIYRGFKINRGEPYHL